jgi:hypothetical protein
MMRGAWLIVRHPAFWAPILLALAIDARFYQFHLGIKFINSDGWGYYLYLPAIFLHGDPQLTFLNRPDLPYDIAQYRFPDGSWQGLRAHGDGYLDKYAFGPAALQMPFFLAALVVAHFQYAAVNGFERTFQIANALSAAFYMGLGSFFVYRAARVRYGAWPSALALGAVILASNLLLYASIDGSYSHVYGYCLLAGLVYLTVQRAESPEAPPLPAFILFGFLMGLAVMVRPTNAVYALLFLVFIYGAPLPRILIGAVCALLASAVAASPQMALWYDTTGNLIYYSYVGEGFNLTSPQLFNYLFSIRKGVFFWHPIYLLMIGALISQIPRRPFEGAVTLLIVLLGLYIGSSWGDFTFGDSFGSRQSIELLPALAVPFAGSIAWLLARRWRWAAAAPGVTLIALNLILFRGYLHNKLPHNNTNGATYAQFWTETLRHVGTILLAAEQRFF